MNLKTTLPTIILALLTFLSLPTMGSAQTLDPQKLLQPTTDTWPTYNGDYSGRRYSTLKQINAENIGSLAVNWMFRANVGPQRGIGNPEIKSTPLLVNGILYFT